MSLALRLFIWFGVLAMMATAVVGFGAREEWKRAEEQRFEEQLADAKRGVLRELDWEATQIRDLLQPKCEHDAYIDKTAIDLEAHELDAGKRMAVSGLVSEEMKALHLDELVLFTGTGEVLGAGHDPAATGAVDASLTAGLTVRGPNVSFRAGRGKRPAALVTRCAKRFGSQSVGLVGARYVEPILARIGGVNGVKLSLLSDSGAPPNPDESTLVIEPAAHELGGLRIVAAVSRKQLQEHLAWVDQRIVLASALTLAVALVAALVLSRRLTRPLQALASQAGEVVRGDPRPVPARGGREIEAFARAFNQAIGDLVQLRKRLATTERIAARREIARRVAHEIKNPLAPIRAAVETLRRLRARNDPAFDDYFDEATRTVLDEVFRITKIVSEFTEFARLPAPHPAPVDLAEVARSTAALYVAGGADVTVEAAASPIVQADKDQVVQVLTNLVQNGLDAAAADGQKPKVTVRIAPIETDRVAISVCDNGPGVPPEMLPRLFEPYATSKPNGTGLGLAIVQRIVHEHGGEITYGSSANGEGNARGAVFRVVLPVNGPALLPAPVERPSLPGPEPRG